VLVHLRITRFYGCKARGGQSQDEVLKVKKKEKICREEDDRPVI